MNLNNFKKLFFENTGIKQTIFKNIFWLAVSEVIPKAIIAFVVILITRYLGVENFGKLSFAFVFVSFFAFITDFGLITLATKEIAKNTVLAKKYIDNILVIKIVLGAFSFGIIVLVLHFFNRTSEVKSLVYLATIWMIVYSFTQFMQSVFRAFEQMEYEALSKIIYAVSLFLIVFFAVRSHLGIDVLFKSYIASVIISFAVVLWFVRKKFTKFWVEIDFNFWNDLFKKAWPFAVFTIFAVIYFQISIIMLSVMKTYVDVSLYSIAFNSVVVFLIFPDIITSSALPTLSKLSKKSGLFKSLTKKIIILLLSLGLFLAIILFFGAPFLIKLIYGKEFIGAVFAFQIMVWILPIRFMNYLFGVALTAADLQKKRLKAVMICALFNVLVNLILIPAFGFAGAAITTLLTEIVLFFIYFRFYKKAV